MAQLIEHCDRDMAMYGTNDIKAFVKSVKASGTYRFSGALMVAASLMSDAQEQMEYGDIDGARRTINRAKLVTFMVMEGELVGTVERA